MTYDQWKDPADWGDWEPVPCPVCAGTGYMYDFADCLVWCDECGASGEIDPKELDKRAREIASCVSISSYLDE
jgi:hypothetical protein